MAIWNSDGTDTNIQSIHNSSAADGDTITIPSGTFTWATGISFTKAVILQGLGGIGSTIVQDNCTTPTQLILWDIRGTSNKAARMTGIEFKNGGRSGLALAPNGLIKVIGSNTNGSTFRWDNCKWNSDLNGFPVFDTVIGVIDHNTVNYAVGSHFQWIYIYDTFWNGHDSGDGAWADGSQYGTDRFLFMENNTITNVDATSSAFITDGLGGTRLVFRNNVCHGGTIGFHGTESGGRTRGGRACEAYSNTFDKGSLSSITSLGGIRSGGLLYHDNTITGFTTPTFHLSNDRCIYTFNCWGGAYGKNPWDINDTGGTGGVFYSGNSSGASSGHTVTVTGSPGWTTNQWVGYVLLRTTDLGGGGSTGFGEIKSNTSNTITYSDTGTFGVDMTFANNDSLEIRKVNQAIDQPGRGGGSLVSSVAVIASGSNGQALPQSTINVTAFTSFPSSGNITIDLSTPAVLNTQKIAYTGFTGTSFTGCTGGTGTLLTNQAIVFIPSGWNDQVTDPCFIWGNSPSISFTPDNSVIRLNEHYYNRAPQAGDAIYPYTTYTYPHPLVSTTTSTGHGKKGIITRRRQ